MMKRIIKGIIFISILGIILIALSQVFNPKNNSKAAGMYQPSTNGILSEKENTIDMLVIGDSETYSSISPMQLWEEKGMTSYVCGSPKQYIFESYEYLKKTLKTQKPKLVVLETNCLFRKYSISKHLEFELNEVLPVFKYHNRWKKINEDDFIKPVNYTHNETLKGFRYSKKVKASVNKNYKKKSDKVLDVNEIYLYYLKEIKDLCEKNDIKFMLISTPSTKNWNYTKHNTIANLSNDMGLEYLDLNLIDELTIDWQKDTRDKGDHLNYAGAKKVTHYLGKYLSDNQLLSSHKDDDYYSKWNEDLKEYYKVVQK